MKAAICKRYGPPEVLEIQDVAKPVPTAREVLIKVHASTVNSSDWFVRSGIPSSPLAIRAMMRLLVGITRPRKRILGLILAGEVERVGARVTRFRAGDRVYAFTKFHFGGYAEYACLPETATIARAPSNLTFEESAAIPYGGLLALHYLRKGDVRSGQRVLIYGASGGAGTSAIQLAKGLGAHVTAVCGPANLELVRSLGADAALDYTQDRSPGDGVLYDLVLDAVGKRKNSALREVCMKSLAPGGRSVSVDDGTPEFSASELATLTEWAEAGKLKPVIDRRYPLDKIVEAHRYVEQEHKKGNVVITIAPDRT